MMIQEGIKCNNKKHQIIILAKIFSNKVITAKEWDLSIEQSKKKRKKKKTLIIQWINNSSNSKNNQIQKYQILFDSFGLIYPINIFFIK